MKISRLSPSAYNQHDGCPHAYFIANSLRYRYPAGIAAQKGTASHRALEILALLKLAEQNNEDSIKLGETQLFVGSSLDDIYEYIEVHEDLTENFDSTALKDYKKYVKNALALQNGFYDPSKRNIVAPEKRVQIPLEYDWAKTPEGDHLILSGIIDLVTEVEDGVYEIIDWKGLALDTPILTNHGWSTMGELQKGDIVFDKDGNPTKIIGKSKIKNKTSYKIRFNDKSEIICDDEHLWILHDGTVVAAPDLKPNNKISVAKPIYFAKQDLPIHPYTLGLWLGDGTSSNGNISINEKETLDYLSNLEQIGPNTEKRQDWCPRYNIKGLRSKLSKLNLLRNKHIPEIYFEGSIDQRLCLLQGLMDSDGSANTCRKQAVFYSSNLTLAQNVYDLLISLGQNPNLDTIKNKTTNFKEGFTTYAVPFRPLNLNPFRLKRKADKINPQWGPGRSHYRSIVSIEKLATNVETQCIKVDSSSSSFLCGKNLIPTHNTSSSTNDFNTGKAKGYNEFIQDPQLRFYHLAATEMYGPDKSYIVSIVFIKLNESFSIAFGPEDLPETLDMIKTKFQDISTCIEPERKQSWKCKKFCEFGKRHHEDLGVPGREQYLSGGVSNIGEPMTMCDIVHEQILHKGIEYVEENMQRKK